MAIEFQILPSVFEFKDDRFYVYEHIRQDTGAVFYVGKGTSRRFVKAVNRNKHWQNIAEKCGRVLVRKLVDGVDEELAFLTEIETIAKYRTLGITLANYTDGGDGSSGFKHSVETRELMSKSRKGANNANHGNKLTDAVKTLISCKMREIMLGENNPMYGKRRPEDVRRKISDGLKGKPISEATRQIKSDLMKKHPQTLARMKPVICLTTGVVYESISAAAKELCLSKSSIRGVCDGKFRQTGGYVFTWSNK